MVALLLAALDQTIVATALPRIVSDLGGLTQYSWVFTAYMLAIDGHGAALRQARRRLRAPAACLVAISIFLVGSALCGLAQNMTQLVVFRAVQGIGAGGLFPLALATIGVIVPPRDRGRYQGLIGVVFAAASIIGPALGGFIVDNASWRWIFYVNLPVGARRARRDRDHDAEARAPGASTRSTGSARPLLAAGTALAPARARLGRPRLPVGLAAGARRARCRRSSCSPPSPSSSGARPSRSCRSTCCATRRSRPGVACIALVGDGDVRDDRLRAALRAGRDRHVRDLVRRRADAAVARRGDDELRSPGQWSRAPAATGRTRSSARSCSAPGCSALADGRRRPNARGGAQHGRRRASGSA